MATRMASSVRSLCRRILAGMLHPHGHDPRVTMMMTMMKAGWRRNYAEMKMRGLVLGVYGDPECKTMKLTGTAQRFSNESGGRIEEVLKQTDFLWRGQSLVVANADEDYGAVALVGLGPEDIGYNSLEVLDECRENVRKAAGTGVVRLREMGMCDIFVEGMGDSESAAEGAVLASWTYQEYRNPGHRVVMPSIQMYGDEDSKLFERGYIKAESQNIARFLSDTPANYMTPQLFGQNLLDQLCECGVSVEIRDRDWIESRNMNAFLHVAKGSVQPPVFIEIGYCGGCVGEKPVALVGKGVTFDTGGLFLKPCLGMAKYRGDLSGAAACVGAIRAAAALSLPINIQVAIPVCENMISGMCMKAGDLVYGLNGKSIIINGPDHEGRLIVADAMVHCQHVYKPFLTIDVGTYTRGMKAALGGAASGIFTPNNELWLHFMKAGSITGDRVWRFPLWEHFTRKVTNITAADLTNRGWGPGGTACKAAAFLREFIICGDWVHIDTGGSGLLADTKEFPYLEMGRMTGRPVRTLVQVLYQLACPDNKECACD